MSTEGAAHRTGIRRRGQLRGADLLHLLRAYQAVIAGRPLEAGNREFLASLIRSSTQLGDALANSPRRSGQPSSGVDDVLDLLAQQRPETAKHLARRVMHVLHGLEREIRGIDGSPDLYLRGPLPVLRPDYDDIQILFGNGLGLGDQIACYRLVSELRDRYSGATSTVYTLYPKLWDQLLPGIREVSYRDRPLRPFEDFASHPAHGAELIVIVDFDCFDLHRRVIAHRTGRDVVEVSLGRLTAWMRRHGSPWIHFETFEEPSYRNYYYFLDAITRRLLALPSDLPWIPKAPAPRKQSGSGRIMVLLNPFTSKPSTLSPADWSGFVRTIRRVTPPSSELDVAVFPGLDHA